MGLADKALRQCIHALADGDRVLSQAEATDLKKRCTCLQKNLHLFRKLQSVYITGAALQISKESVACEVELDVEDEKIWMPSDFPPRLRTRACYAGLAAKEEELREAECLDGLEMIRNTQRMLQAFYAYRDQNIRGQAALTRAGSTVERQIEHSKVCRGEVSSSSEGIAEIERTRYLGILPEAARERGCGGPWQDPISMWTSYCLWGRVTGLFHGFG